MKIHEVLQKLSDDEVGMQGLNAAITNVKTTRNGNAVTFLTDAVTPAHLVGAAEMPVMICLFIDRKAWEREMSKARAVTA